MLPVQRHTSTFFSREHIDQTISEIQERVNTIARKNLYTIGILETGKKIALAVTFISFVAGFPVASIVCAAFYGAILDEQWTMKDRRSERLLAANRELSQLLSSLSNLSAKQIEKLKKQNRILKASTTSLQTSVTSLERSVTSLETLEEKTRKAQAKYDATLLKLGETQAALSIIERRLDKAISNLTKQVDRLTKIH
ncbi:MAG: hypothetical protein S4CHLAM37_14180 [Chlamydiia bacterium]|nr:hypothetical protein [Chlamydiia bacterium]